MLVFSIRGYTRPKIYPSLSDVTERWEGMEKNGKGKGGVQGRTGFSPYALSLAGFPLPFPHACVAGQSTFVRVTVNEARRCFPYICTHFLVLASPAL
jgi:hypothetical protein